MGLLFSHRRVPSCRRRASHTGERRLRRPCVRCLALPGKGRCRCACSTLFALRGKSASELARRFWPVHGKEFFAGRFAHQETFPARRETGNGPSLRRYAVSRAERALLLSSYRRRTLPASFAARFFPRPPLPSFSPALAKEGRQSRLRADGPCSPLPALFHAPWMRHGANGLAGHSARTRSRDSSLENPFLGTAAVSPQPPSPQRRRRQAPAHGLAAVYSHHRPARTEPQHTRPLLVGRACVESEPTALAGGTAAS